MAKTITIRMDDETYKSIKKQADLDNRAISNYIEKAVKQYIADMQFTEDAETIEILSNESLLRRLKRGSQEAKKKKGKFAA